MNRHRLKRILGDVFDVHYHCRRVKWRWQLMTRGWCDRDCWDLGNTMASRFAEALAHFRKFGSAGVPGGLCGPEGEDVDGGVAKWEAILAQIETGLRAAKHLMSDCDCFIGAYHDPPTRAPAEPEEYRAHEAKYRALWERGMDLLKEWQLAIWN